MNSDIVAVWPALFRSAFSAFRGEESEGRGLADEIATGEAEDCGRKDVRRYGGR